MFGFAVELVLEVLLPQLLGPSTLLNNLLDEILTSACGQLLPRDGCQRLWRLLNDIVQADPGFVIIVVGAIEHNIIEIKAGPVTCS